MSGLNTVPQGKGWINTINDNFKKFHDQDWQTNFTMVNGWKLYGNATNGYKVISYLGTDYLLISLEVVRDTSLTINPQTWVQVCNLPIDISRFKRYIARFIYLDNGDKRSAMNVAVDNGRREVGFSNTSGVQTTATGAKINLILASV